MYLIVGLGNPDLKYQLTYHNLGFMAVDCFAIKNNLDFDKTECKAKLCKFVIGNNKVILAKPQTYMNLSGESVSALARFYKIPHENILVIYDDLDLEAGAIRIRKSGGAGTHNGMKNIVSLLPGEDFPRIRIGSKQDTNGKLSTIDYVLSNVSEDRKPLYKETFLKINDVISDFINGKSLDNIMNEYNKK